MQKELSVFKSTILLYVVVLILPFGFIYLNTTFETIKEDTEAISTLTQISTGINRIAMKKTPNTDIEQSIRFIDEKFNTLTYWVAKNNESPYYVGARTLKEDFDSIYGDWIKCKSFYTKHNETSLRPFLIKTNNELESFAVVMDKLVRFKQDKAVNTLYGALLIIILTMLLAIYSVRVYIEYQIRQNAIYDYESQLYNKNYFLEHLKTTCARATRYKYPLSVLSISVKNLDEIPEDKELRKKLFESIGGMLLSLTRTSDVACRYDKNHISIILPFTEAKNAEILRQRIEDTFIQHDFGDTLKPVFKFSITEYQPKETPQEFTKRAEETLKNA